MMVATAEATGQSRLLKNSCHSTRPIMMLSGPPSSSGITNSPTAGMNTSIEPAMIPPRVSGTITLKKVFSGRAPRSSDASTSE
ncbi:Uncharacterised protein [Acinetobacter baumannii]|nr:Uncharacterised protein [Acinetobacter baumannii]